jgi:hypothetical protein
MKVFDMSTLDDLKPTVKEVSIQGTTFYVMPLSACAQAQYNAQGTRMAPLQKVMDDPAMKIPSQKDGMAIANEYNDIMLCMCRISLMNGVVDANGNKQIKTDAQFRRVYDTLAPDVLDELVAAIQTAGVTDDEKKESGE